MLRAACVLEATAGKAGNVHPQAAFMDLIYRDFVDSANVIAPILARTCELGVGRAILEAVAATKAVSGSNINLGITLLLAPLAAVPAGIRLVDGIGDVLNSLSRNDADLAYQAIRLAQPGAMGEVEDQDIRQPPTTTLREAMCLAADRDLVARQYVNDFEQVFEGAEMLRELVTPKDTELETAVTRLYLQLLAKYTDSLIERKFGRPIAEEVSRRAREIVQSSAGYAESALTSLDSFLRAGPVMLANPGTTADLVTASLFVALRKGIIQLPLTRSASRRG
jgi:triphosphoribosyl-dephospho-CoA synthase